MTVPGEVSANCFRCRSIAVQALKVSAKKLFKFPVNRILNTHRIVNPSKLNNY